MPKIVEAKTDRAKKLVEEHGDEVNIVSKGAKKSFIIRFLDHFQAAVNQTEVEFDEV